MIKKFVLSISCALILTLVGGISTANASCGSGNVEYQGACYKKITCKNGGTQKGDKCSCKAGWSGNLCQTAKKCSYTTTKCATGYTATGKTCQSGNKKYVECKANACTGYVTKCPTGYAQSASCQSGKTKKYKCEKCANGYIKYNGKCIKKLACKNGGTQKGDKCSCKAGWSGNLCQTAKKCPYSTTKCATGYTATGKTCQGGNKKYVECKANACTGYVTKCLKGYAQSATCQSGKTKKYKCEKCASGYVKFNGKCYKKLSCKNGGTQKGDKCSCKAGWSGNLCQTANTCAYKAVSCAKGYVVTETCMSGNKKYVKCAKKLDCKNGGTQNGEKCACTAGWTGADCSTKATCAYNTTKCGAGYVATGKTCQSGNTKYVECKANPCTGYVKSCPKDYYATSDTCLSGTTTMYKCKTDLTDFDKGASIVKKTLTDADNVVTWEDGDEQDITTVNNQDLKVVTNSESTVTGVLSTQDEVANAFAASGSKEVVVDIEQRGNGNVYGMRAELGAYADDGLDVDNAISGGNASVRSTIKINNKGNGNAYGMYTNTDISNPDNDGIYLSNVWADNESEGIGVIDILNSGNGYVYGIFVGETSNTDKVVEAVNAQADENALGAGMININNSGSGNVYGLRAKSWAVNASTHYGDEREANAEGLININNSGNGDVYAIYSDDNAQNASNNSEEAYGLVRINNSGNGNTYGLVGKVVQNAVSDSGDESTGIINIINRGNGNAYGMYSNMNGNRVFNKTNGMVSSDIEMANVGNGLAVGMYSKNGWMENSGSITIHNLGNGTAVGMMADGSTDAYNSGTITIDRESYTDEETHVDGPDTVVVYQANSATGGQAIGIYGSADSSITNSGTIAINGTDKAYGIYSEGNDVTNTGNILINGEHTENAVKLNGGKLFQNGVLKVNAILMCKHGNQNGNSCVCDEGWSGADCNTPADCGEEYRLDCGTGYHKTDLTCLSGDVELSYCAENTCYGYVADCGIGRHQVGAPCYSGKVAKYQCEDNDCSAYQTSCGDGYNAVERCVSGTTQYYECRPKDVPEGYTTAECGEGYTQKGYMVSGETEYYLCKPNDCSRYYASCGEGYNATAACLSGTTQYYTCMPKDVPEGYTTASCGEGYTQKGHMVSGETDYYLCEPNDCSGYKTSCGEGYNATAACLSGTTQYYACDPKPVPEGYTTAACGEGYTQKGYMVSGETEYYLCKPNDCSRYYASCGEGYNATAACLSGTTQYYTCTPKDVPEGYTTAECGEGYTQKGYVVSGSTPYYLCEPNDCSGYKTSCGDGYNAVEKCLSGTTQYYECNPKPVPEGYTSTPCGEGYTQSDIMLSGMTPYYLCSPKDCSGYEASCGDGYRATQACLSGTTPYYTCTPNDVPEGYTTTPCGEGYTQKGYVVSGTTPYYLCELNDCTGYKTSCSGGYNAIKACVSGTTQYYECEPKPVPEGYTSTPCGEGYTVDSVMLSGMTTYYLCKPNDCSEYEASCGEGYRATQACLSGTTPYYDCTPKDVPEGYTTAACGEGYTQTGYMISGTTPYYLCEEADCSAYQTSCGAGYDSEYICLSGTTRYYDCTPKAVPEGYVDHQCGTGYIETASMLSGETTYYLCAVKDCATGSTDIAGCGAGYHVAETGEYSGDLACYTCEENACKGFDYSGECPEGLRIVDACQKGHTLMLKCEVLTVSNEPLVGKEESVNNSTITLTAEDQDVYGMKDENSYCGYDVINASRQGQNATVEAEINITHNGNGNVYGMYSRYNTYNTSGSDGEYNTIGKINIENIGNADVYGMYSMSTQGDNTTNGYRGTGIIRINNIGHGNVYGIASSKVHNAYYGTGIIRIVNQGLGRAYGLYGKTISNESYSNYKRSLIEMANIGDGLAVGMYAKDGTIENSGTIKIHNLGNGTAVGIYADGTTTVNNSGNIIIDRNSYRDTKLTSDRSDDEIYYPISERGGKAIGIYGSRDITNSGVIRIDSAVDAYGIWSERQAVFNTGTILIDGQYTENAIRLGGGKLFQDGKMYVGANWENAGTSDMSTGNMTTKGLINDMNNNTINIITTAGEVVGVDTSTSWANALNGTAEIIIHNTGDGNVTGINNYNAKTINGEDFHNQTKGRITIDNNGNGIIIGSSQYNASTVDSMLLAESVEVLNNKTTIGEISITNRGNGHVYGVMYDGNSSNTWSLDSKSYVSGTIEIDNEGMGDVYGAGSSYDSDLCTNVYAFNEPTREYDDGYISNQYVSELETVGNITIRNTSTAVDDYSLVFGLSGNSINLHNSGYNSVASATINITNSGFARVEGICGSYGEDVQGNAYIHLNSNKNNWLNDDVQFRNESDAQIIINNSGDSDVLGISNGSNLYAENLYGNNIVASALIDITNSGNGNVYGIEGYRKNSYNLYTSDDVGSDSEISSIIRLHNYDVGNAYGIYSGADIYNNYGSQGIAEIIVENHSLGNAYGIKGERNVYNLYASDNVGSDNEISSIIRLLNYGAGNAYGIRGNADVYNNYGNQGTAKIIVENHSSGNAYGLFKQYNEGSVYNNNSGDAKSIIEIANLSNGLAVGIYSGDSYQESTIENSGDITIHNIYDGTAVGILGLGENDSEIMTIINSGNITIDREEYVDEYGSTYSAYSETGGKAIGIYGNAYTNIINSGTITINGADAAFGIWSEGGNVTNTGTIVIDNMNCVGGDCSIYSNAIKLNGGQLFQDGILYKGADWNSSGEVSYGCVNGYWNDGYCECWDGYTGERCDQYIYDEDYCVNGNWNDGYCECWDGYTGERCDQYIYDEDYCVNGDWNGDHCECWSGYTGSHCEYVQYDDCSSYTYSECPSDQHVVASCYDGNQTWYKCDYDSIDNEKLLVGSTHNVNDDIISLNNTQNRDVYGMKQSDGADGYAVNSETSGSITINNSGIGNVYGMHGGEVYNALNNGSSQNNGEIKIVSSNADNVYGIYATELAQNSNASGWTENEGTQNITYDMNATINIDNTGDGNVYGLYSEHSAYNALGSKYTTCLDEGLCYLISKNANGLININNTGNGDVYGIYATSRSSNVGTGNGTIRISNNGTGYIYGIRGQDINNASYSDDTTGRIIIINNGAGKAYGMFSQYVKNYTSEEKNVYSIIEMVNRSTGLAVGMYGNDGQIENNGEIKIHNLGNGVAVGIYADGESEVYNNGIITIDRESYTDDKGTAITTDDRIYSVTGNGGDKAIGIYGSAGSRIDNSGIIRINGAATAYGIWSEGDDVENDGIIEINGQYTANAIRLNGGQLFQNGIMKTVAEWNKTGIDGRENDGSEFICNNDEISKDSTTTGSLVGFDVIDIIGLNAYAHTQNETGVIDVTQSGTGNVFGMRGLVSTPQDEDEENYDDYSLMNAATDSAYTATGIIRVTNIGDGKKNEGVYGMYSNSHDMDVTNATYGEDTATDKTLAVGEIEVNNTGDKNVYGICSGEEGINAEGDVKGHSNGKITVINNGDGDVYGIKSYEAAYNSDATENSSAEARIVVKNIGDGFVYGLISERSKIFNSAAGHDRGLGQTKDTATTNGLISIDNVGNGNVYGMKGILQSDYNKVIYNALSAYNSTATGRVRVSNEGTGYAYGAYGTVVYNTYVSGKYADYNPQATGTINVINRADGKSYGMCGWRVYNNSDANQTSTIEMINAGDGLAVGVYTAYNGYVENSGDIKIHNLGNGTAVGIVAEGSSTVKNSGNITIDRSTYVDGETSYSATGNGGTAIGIYGGSNSSITNSGTITINGADVAYGIWSNSGGVANTREGTIIINGTGCVGNACYDDANAIKLNGGVLFQDGEMIANAGEMSPMSPMSEDVDDETLETVPLDAMRTLPAANPITDEVVITPQRVAAYLNLDDFGGTVVASETSQFIVEGAIAGDLAMNNSIIENGFDTTYTVKDMIQAEDASGLRLVSQSALFDVALENDSDAVMTMKSFNDVVANQSVADFLKQNYSEGNNEDLFGMLKGKETVAALNSTLDSLTGSDVFNRFNFEDMTMMRELNMDVNHTLFNDKEDNLVTSGNVAPFYFDSESGADGKYALYNRRIGKKSFGLSLAFSNVNSSDRHDNNTRNDESFQMSVPFGYNARGFKFITAPRFGYAYGHYDRDGYESRTYKGTMEKRMFGLMNEVRYPVKLSGWKIAPAAEFNMLGYHLKGSEDVQAYSLNIKSQNNYSVEAGFGLYADKELQPTKNSTLKLNAGVAMYHEFADPYTMELGMHGMNGSFKIRDERRKDNRAVLRTGFDYSLGDITVEGSVASFIDGTTHTKAGLDLRYNF